MNDPIEHNDFEKQLKKAAEDFQPTPSNRVWENVRDELHPRRRTYFLAAAAAILLLLALGVYFLQSPSSHAPAKSSLAERTSPSVPPNQTSPAPSNNNSVSNGRETNQPVQRESFSGNANPGNQKHGETASTGLTVELMHKRSLAKNNREGQATNSIIENPIAETSGLSYLKNLSIQLKAYSLIPKEIPTESFPLQYAGSISNFSSVTSQAKDHLVHNKKAKVISGKLHGKPSFEIFYSPSLGYRTLAKGSSRMMANSSYPSIGQSVSLSQSPSPALSSLKQQPEWSWSAGARIIFPLRKSWSLQTGLSAAEMNYRIAAYGTHPVYIQNNAATYSYYAMPGRSISTMGINAFAAARSPQSYLHNNYIIGEIPLLVNKQFGNPHGVTFNLGAGAGLSYLFHSAPVIYSPFSGSYLTDNRYIRSVNGDFLMEASLLIPLSAHLKLGIGPSFQYQILSSYKNYTAVKEHPYLIGLKTGLQLDR